MLCLDPFRPTPSSASPSSGDLPRHRHHMILARALLPSCFYKVMNGLLETTPSRLSIRRTDVVRSFHFDRPHTHIPFFHLLLQLTLPSNWPCESASISQPPVMSDAIPSSKPPIWFYPTIQCHCFSSLEPIRMQYHGKIFVIINKVTNQCSKDDFEMF